MRLAIHFDEEMLHKKDPVAFWPIAEKLFPKLLAFKKPKITSQMSIGSLLLYRHAYKVTKKSANGWTEKLDRKEFKRILELWINSPAHLFCTFNEKTLNTAISDKLFVFCLANIDREQAKELDRAFKKFKPYRGALEIDESLPIHAALYSHGLCPFGRIHGTEFQLFWDGFIDDTKDTGTLAEIKKLGFRKVSFESLNGRYSIFDTRHTPEQTLLAGKTLTLCSGLLADTAERVLNALTDIAPALPEKLHGAISAYASANTSEALAHSALSCRRVIEYVTDCIFPPQSEPSPEGRKLDKTAYKNRLLAYVDKSRSSDTSIDLIVASTATLAEQLDRLQNAVNKGIHADLLEVEGRRCIIRTIMLLDDLISLKEGPFEIKPDLETLDEFFKNRSKDE